MGVKEAENSTSNAKQYNKNDSLAVEELLSDLVLEVPDPDHKLAADATPTVRCALQPLHADCAFMVLTK